jgi:hypothetical protein
MPTQTQMPVQKIVLIGALALIILGGSWYILSSPTIPPVAEVKPTQTQQQETPQAIVQEETIATPPSETATNDQIVDYLVDGLAKDESITAKQSIDTQSPTSNSSIGGVIDTNF